LFRQYLDARLATYRKLPDLDASKAEQARATALQQGDLDAGGGAAGGHGSSPPQMLLLPALNTMFDIATTRQ
jgi:hypothetical protein